jgi:hypothetical protein
VSDKLDLTKEQSVMLALFINLSDDDSIRLYQLSNYVQCPTVRILRYMNEIDELEKREFIRCYKNKRGRCKGISYRVPFDVIEAMKCNEKYTPRNCTGLTCQELFGELEEIFELRKDKEITYETMVQKINSLFSDNSHLKFVKSTNSCFPEEDDEDDKMLLVLFCHLCVNDGDDNIGVGVNVETGEMLELRGNGAAEVGRAHGDGVLVRAADGDLHEPVDEGLGRVKVREALGQVDGIVGNGNAGHAADDGIGELLALFIHGFHIVSLPCYI